MIWKTLATMARILPLVIIAVREDRLKDQAMDNILGQLMTLYSERLWKAREALRNSERN